MSTKKVASKAKAPIAATDSVRVAASEPVQARAPEVSSIIELKHPTNVHGVSLNEVLPGKAVSFTFPGEAEAVGLVIATSAKKKDLRPREVFKTKRRNKINAIAIQLLAGEQAEPVTVSFDTINKVSKASAASYVSF